MRRAIFISYLSKEYSRSAVLASALKKYSGLEIEFFMLENFRFRAIFRLRKYLRRLDRDENLLIVMAPAHLAVVPTRIFFKGKIVLDAGWPLSDSSEIREGRKSFSYIRDKFIDILSFYMADIVLLESQAQLERVAENRRSFARSSLQISYSGLKEDRFETEKAAPTSRSAIGSREPIKVLFRGKYNQEAGLELIESAFENRSDFQLTIACSDLPINHPRVTGINYVVGILNQNELRSIFLDSDLALGQFGEPDRVSWTIPHKIFEYAYFGIPTVCLEQTAVTEIFTEEQFFFVKRNSLNEFLDVLSIDHKKTREILLLKSKSVRNQFLKLCSERAIAGHFLRVIEDPRISHMPGHENLDISQQ